MTLFYSHRLVKFIVISVLIGLYSLLSSPVVLSQPRALPKADETLGFPVGADFHLATYEQSLSYFKKLDEASDLMKLVYVGETSEGRPWYFALISAKKNLITSTNIEPLRNGWLIRQG